MIYLRTLFFITFTLNYIINSLNCKHCSTSIYNHFYTGLILNMTVSGLSSTFCIIKWNPPFPYMQYGSFDDYIVECNISNTNTIITSDITQKLNVSVIFLKPFTSYICCVTPQWTTNGIGKSHCITFTTLEDGE